MGLSSNAPAWTPGLCSSGERSGDSPDRNGRAAHCVVMHHKREEGVESDGVGWLNLPVNQDKHRADKFSQRVPTGRLPKRLMDGKLVGGEHPDKGRPEQNRLDCLKDEFQAFGATDGSMVDNRLTFGVDRAVWTLARTESCDFIVRAVQG